MDTRLKTMEKEFNQHLQEVVNNLHEAYASRIAQGTAREVEMEIEIKRLQKTIETLQSFVQQQQQQQEQNKEADLTKEASK